ncbi:MAG: bacteriocin fulvocin C-related protein [Paraprevotella sp.]|nr:bacteriocin fulvocin C-related protein [Paraprevotella sp.]
MKTFVIKVILLIPIAVLYSCETENDLRTYSCDKTINEWVSDNIPSIRTMNRNNWNNVDEERKRATYRAFTPEQRYKIWVGKIQQTLTLDWNENEKIHILKLLTYIETHPEIFNDEVMTESQYDELELFAYKWKEDAILLLKWSEKLVFAIIASPNNLIDKDGNIEITEYRNRSISSTESDCNCNASWHTYNNCYSGDCKHTEKGCGPMWTYNCNGIVVQTNK